MKVVSELMESSRKAITQKFPFLEYVNRGMLYHAEQAQINGISQQDFLKTFPRPEWVKHHNMLEKAKLRRYTLEVSLYYILAEAGMSSLIQAHSTRQSCFEIENERYGLPILAASATKSIEAINTMLEIEAERLPKSSLDKLHSLMPESLNIQCAASRNFMYDKKDDLLHQLMEHGNKKIALLYLLTHECNINVRDPQGQTIPISPIERGFSMPARVLAQEGSDMPATGTPEGTRLHLASSHGHTEVAKLLVACGADLSAVNKYGQMPLHVAVSHGHTEVAKLLVDCGADLSAVNKYGQTPLHVAVSHGYIEVVKLLVVYNTNLSAVGNSGQTPLHVALLHGHPEVAKLLIVCDADLSAVNKYGQTPLHIASLYGYATVVNLLVSRGADLSAVNKDGRTPLHLASLWGNTRMVILLLGYGADPSATDTTGQTSSQLASMGGYTETVRLLREHGANLLDTDESG
ncbi:hypothetical protein GQX73_g4258 [Xylaria multiplex]|uniref:Uncharacterized protein n=1 Tax=Xylaria multiplex TaxID=323545 RepID=A0A7C8IUD3_9PEZI|nr:hypothetical protein GQX73_g4258 [Xylaria multiplex]